MIGAFNVKISVNKIKTKIITNQPIIASLTASIIVIPFIKDISNPAKATNNPDNPTAKQYSPGTILLPPKLDLLENKNAGTTLFKNSPVNDEDNSLTLSISFPYGFNKSKNNYEKHLVNNY